MDLLAEIDAAHRRPGVQQCTLAKALEAMPPEEAEQIQIAIADTERYRAAAIGRVLRAHGHKVADDMITRHRTGRCLSCQR
jgi:hypothetical protein